MESEPQIFNFYCRWLGLSVPNYNCIYRLDANLIRFGLDRVLGEERGRGEVATIMKLKVPTAKKYVFLFRDHRTVNTKIKDKTLGE